MSRITVPWMNLIRAQLKLVDKDFEDGKSSERDVELINAFIYPILAYGEQVEDYINDKGGWDISHLNGKSD